MNIICSLQAPAKLNIFLKITDKIQTGANAGYHEISSRFVRFDGIFDELSIIERISKNDLIFDNKITDNILFKAFYELAMLGFKENLKNFFKNKQLFLQKNIPSGAGLGGGSSDAAAFLLLMQKEFLFDDKTLMSLSAKIGADVSFFASKHKSANVSGYGQIVECFDDEIPKLGVVLSDIFCATKQIYKAYSKANFYKDKKMAKKLETLSSKEILNSFCNFELNDLLPAVVAIYAAFDIKENEFLSGSGSAKFKQILENI